MGIHFDRNVLLGVLLNRAPHVVPASRLMVHVEQKRIEGLMGATSVTTIHYLATKAVGGGRARRHFQRLLSLFDVAPVGRVVLSDALSLGFPDYEDAVLHEAARHAGATGIVTRDPGGFARARVHVYSPDELLTMARALPPSTS